MELEREIEERPQKFRSPEAFGVEGRDTRPGLCEWVAYSLLPAELGPKRRKAGAE